MDTKAYELHFSETQKWQEFDSYYRGCMGDMNAWSVYVEKVILTKIKEKKLSMKAIASQIKVDYKTLRMIKNGKIQRDTLICLGILLDMTYDEINEMLLRAKYHMLYPKAAEDAIWSYIIRHRPDSLIVEGNTIKEKYQTWQKAYDNLFQTYCQISDIENEDATLNTFMVENAISKDGSFEEIMLEIIPGFHESYRELKTFLEKWKKSIYPDSVLEENENRDLGQAYYRVFYKFEKKGKLPSRAFFIAFGIHAGMKKKEIDQMLSLAKMQPLYARDFVDARLIYYLSQKKYSIESLADDLTQDIDAYEEIPLIRTDMKAILKYL